MADDNSEGADICHENSLGPPPSIIMPPGHSYHADPRRFAIFISSLSPSVQPAENDVPGVRSFEARSSMLEEFSRSSSPASEAIADSPPESITSDDDNSEIKQRMVTDSDFEVEEMHPTEIQLEGELETLKPSQYEDPESDVERKKPERWSMRQQEMQEETGIVNEFRGLCTNQDEAPDSLERDLVYPRARNRYSAGKRTYSQSIDSGSEGQDEGNVSPQDPESSGKRLRRRIKRTSNRNSFIFNDPYEEHALAEVEEPDDDVPRSLASFSQHTHTNFTKTPYCDGQGSHIMDIDQLDGVEGNFI